MEKLLLSLLKKIDMTVTKETLESNLALDWFNMLCIFLPGLGWFHLIFLKRGQRSLHPLPRVQLTFGRYQSIIQPILKIIHDSPLMFCLGCPAELIMTVYKFYFQNGVI